MSEPKFPKAFHKYVCEGDTLAIEHNGISYVAKIVRDDDTESPDKRDDGFWPSLDPESTGYIGPKSKSTLRKHMARAKATLEAWNKDEWFYCGVMISASFDDIELDANVASLWGIECNYPKYGRHDPNAYLTEVANELLGEAITFAAARLRRIVELASEEAKNFPEESGE